MKKYSKPLQGLVSLLSLILLLVWMQGGFTAKTPPGTTQAAEKGRAVQGSTAMVERKEILELMLWPGTVTARTVAQIAPKVPARVLAIGVKSGDLVKSGQILAHLDQSELQSRVNQARSALESAEAQVMRTSSELRRVRSLFDQEAATQRTLESAQAAARASEAQVAEQRAAIAASESLLAETELRAPFDGTVVRRNLEPGDMALPGSTILTIQSSQRLRVEASIPERCARGIRLGDSLKALTADQAYEAKVEEISPVVDPQTRSVLVKAGLEGPARPGAFVWLEQACGGREALLIPATAVSRSGQLESVELVTEGQTRLRHIRTGKTSGGKVEVLSGLKEGDIVSLEAEP